jgi:urate oxidase
VIELAAARYGKAGVRLMRVDRSTTPHRVRDLTVAIALEGDFVAAHTDGDNTNVVATDTMKNTAYAFAKQHLDGSIEAYGLALAEHFLAFPQVTRATVNVREHGWHPIAGSGGGAPARDAFVRSGEGTRVATVSATNAGVTVEAGVEDLIVLKTTRSSFSGFPRDEYTTLPDTDDRMAATKVTAIWAYGSPDVDADTSFEAIRADLLRTWADHDSPSIQTSIWIIARAILERHDEVREIRLVMPNLHHWLVDLSTFGLANDREIYTPTSEPYGLIEATVRRGEG